MMKNLGEGDSCDAPPVDRKWPLALTISGIVLVVFGASVAVDWIWTSMGAICGGGPEAVSCSMSWPDPRLPLPLLLIGAALVILGIFFRGAPRRVKTKTPAASVVLLVTGSGVLEMGISALRTYLFSGGVALYVYVPSLLGMASVLLAWGAGLWWSASAGVT